MNIISQFNEFLEKSFNQYLKIYFSSHNYLFKSSDFNNYYHFIHDLDSFSTTLTKDIFKGYIEYIDNCFFHSSYRKNFCTSKGFYERKNFVTLFGEISFKRRYYFDKNTHEYFFFTDLFFDLPKRKHFDPFVCAECVEKSAENSYSKAGKIVADKIGSKISNSVFLSRATVRNIVLSFSPIVPEEKKLKRIERLFVMLDEKFVPSQFNHGNDHMIKAAVIFENTKLEYKTKRKLDSINRYRLVNSHTCADIHNHLDQKVVDYIYNSYDTDYLKEICFMGDCAKWIKNFPKSCLFKFHPDMKNTFSMDGFHFAQALKLLTTNKNEHWYNALSLAVKKNNKDLFKKLCFRFIEENKSRESVIIQKMEYILNNWQERQIYQNRPYLKCSMESHISHIFADLFTARPKAYSKKGLDKLLQIRLLKVNGYNLKDLYFKQLHQINDSTILQKNIKLNQLNYHTNESFYDKELKLDKDIYFPYEFNVIKYI